MGSWATYPGGALKSEGAHRVMSIALSPPSESITCRTCLNKLEIVSRVLKTAAPTSSPPRPLD